MIILAVQDFNVGCAADNPVSITELHKGPNELKPVKTGQRCAG